MEEPKGKITDEELKQRVKEAVCEKMPKGPGEAGNRMLDDPLHRRWKIAVNDAPVVAK